MGPDKLPKNKLLREVFKSHPVFVTNPIVNKKHDRFPRNKPCPCGSGKKFKHCHWVKINEPGDEFESKEFKDYVDKDYAYCNKKYRRLTDAQRKILLDT